MWASARDVEDDEVEDMDTSEPDWAWFYLAECGQWHMFGSDPLATSSESSEMIEQSYNRNRHGCVEFHTHKYAYRIDFAAMQQTNLTTGKQRPIKRDMRSMTTFRSICDRPAVPFPCHWERVYSDEPYQLISVGRDTHEFRDVKALYEATMSNPIRSIHRIQNSDLWEFFCRKKAQLRRLKKVVEVQERMLFHGTDACNIQAICTLNFDWRLAGSHGCVYGKGSYFARDARYSSKYCKPSQAQRQFPCPAATPGLPPPPSQGEPAFRSLFVARVLVGEYTLGFNALSRPPFKDCALTSAYDSCVDDVQHPKIFVVFDSNQVYPEYLIEFYESHP